MRILRWPIGLILILWGLHNLLPLAFTVGVKTESMTVPPDVIKYVPLALATAWWQVALWGVAAVLFLVSGWRLLRARSALPIYVLTVLLSFATWYFMFDTPAYRQAFSAAEQQLDYVIFAAEFAIGVLIWWIERRRRVG